MRQIVVRMVLVAVCMMLALPSVEALDSRVLYRLRGIKRSLQMAQRQLQQGRQGRAKRSMRSIERRWAMLWRYYKDRISMKDPEIAQVHKQIQDTKKQLAASRAAPQGQPAAGRSPYLRGRRPYRSARRRRRRARGVFRGGRPPRGVRSHQGPSPQLKQTCYSKEVLKNCKQLHSRVYKVCSFDHGSMLLSWHQRLAKMPEVASAMKQFLTRHKGCYAFDRSVRIKVPGSYTRTMQRWKNMCSVAGDRDKCSKAISRSKALWTKTVARIAKSGDNKQLRFVLKHNSNPMLGEDVSGIRRRISARIQGAKRARARSAARLASRRCPQEKYNNPALRRAVRRAIYSVQKRPKCRGYARAGARRACLSSRMYVRSYHLMSRPSSPRYNRWHRYYSQTVRVDACIKRVLKGRTYCRVYHYKLKRVKPVRGRWGVWRHRSFSYTDLLCKHLR